MAIAFVRQSTAQTGSNGGALTITAATNGNCLVFFIGLSTNSQSVSSLSLTGATFSKAASGNTQRDCEIWYAPAVSGSGTSVTVNLSGSATWYAVCAEFSGVATSSVQDGSGVDNAPSSGSTVATGNLTTTNANDVLVACYVGSTSHTVTTGPTGWSRLNEQNGLGPPTFSFGAAYDIVAATGTYSASWTLNGSLSNPELEIAALQQATVGSIVYDDRRVARNSLLRR